MEHTDGTEESASVDAIHNLMDNLILNVFETMRQIENPTGASKVQSQRILDSYKQIRRSIEHLSFINATEEDLNTQMQAKLQECSDRTKNIAKLEETIQLLRSETAKKLDTV